MKKFTAKTALSVLSFSLFALCLADTYYVHKSDVDASIIRLIETLKKQPAEDSAEENAQTNPEGE